VRQHARLRRDLVTADQRVDEPQQRFHGGHAVSRRIDSDHGIAAAVHQSIDNRGGNALRVVGRMIRLQPNREPTRQTERVAKRRHDAALLRDENQILVRHQLRHRGDHLGRETRRQRGQRKRVSLVAEQPISKLADAEVRDRSEGSRVMRIHDEPRHFIGFIRNDRLLEKAAQRHLGEAELRGNALLRRRRCQPREFVARTSRRRLRQQLAQRREGMPATGNGAGQGAHGVEGWCGSWTPRFELRDKFATNDLRSHWDQDFGATMTLPRCQRFWVGATAGRAANQPTGAAVDRSFDPSPRGPVETLPYRPIRG
jgi:hypothetical protein